jgi:CubicO group peptidase (beta-lactamase class C family)
LSQISVCLYCNKTGQRCIKTALSIFNAFIGIVDYQKIKKMAFYYRKETIIFTMKRNCLLILLLSWLNGFAQTAIKISPALMLPVGKTIESDLDPYKQDLYKIKLSKGQFASIRVYQKNVGLNILVYDPLDSLQQIVDENGIGQNEVVTIHAVMPGDYTLKVTWNFNKPLSGQYAITLAGVERSGESIAQKAQQLFDSWYEKEAPGAAMAVVKNNEIVLKQATGLANVEENVPLTSSSVFEIASCSKQFTAFAIAMLVDKKIISMEDDIRKYLPEMPDYGNTITIANLVYHTSGIRNTDALEFTGFSQEDNITLPMAVRFAAAQKQVKFKPGERFNYCNTNYNLLAEIVARVTKQSFSSWTRQNIFKPLGMEATFFKEDPGYVYRHKVLCYKPAKEGFVQRPNNYAATGSAGLCTSIDDLVKWVNSFDTKQLITKNMEALLMTTGPLNDGSRTKYAFGNEIGAYHGFKRIEHLGLLLGYRTAIARFPDEKLSIIYLSNDNNDATYQRFYKIRDLFLNVPVEKPRITTLPKVEEVIARLEKKADTTADLTQYKGIYYSDELNAALPLVIKDKKLVIVHPRLNEIVLSQAKYDNFGFIQFSRNTANEIVSLTVLGENIQFRKIGN